MPLILIPTHTNFLTILCVYVVLNIRTQDLELAKVKVEGAKRQLVSCLLCGHWLC